MEQNRSKPADIVETRDRYPYLTKIATRWMDNDVYGHVNNVVYYSYFDTIINDHLIAAGLDIFDGQEIGVAVETGCRFHRGLRYPEVIDAGLRVGHLGTSSVRYEIGLFSQGQREAAATGFFVHVFVDRGHRRPVPIPAGLRRTLETLRPPSP